MQSLLLTTERQKTEWKTIKTIAQNNNFPDKVITTKITNTTKNTQNTGQRNKHKQKQKNGQSSPTTAQ
jgi:7-cyano-7-deazaguanine synthase in queuosine biosynthesis